MDIYASVDLSEDFELALACTHCHSFIQGLSLHGSCLQIYSVFHCSLLTQVALLKLSAQLWEGN